MEEMTTQQQIIANQKNAQKSTGPISLQGKAIVSQNATKHGILSSQLFIKQEEKVLYREFFEETLQNLLPIGSIEYLLADRIISTAWRLRRIIDIETFLLQKEESDYGAYGKIFVGNTASTMAILSRYERSLENSLYRAMKELKVLQQSRENSCVDRKNGFVSQARGDFICNL